MGLRPTQQGRAWVWPVHRAPTLRKSPEQPSGEQWESHSHGELSQLSLQGPSLRPHNQLSPSQVTPSWEPPGCPPSSHPLSPAVDGGGTIAHWLDADYLFSSDAAHPDTRRWAKEALMYLVESIYWILTSRKSQGGVFKDMAWICQDLLSQWGQGNSHPH